MLNYTNAHNVAQADVQVHCGLHEYHLWSYESNYGTTNTVLMH